MGKLEWELTEADERGIAYLSLPLTGDEARLLLRGERPRNPLRAALTQTGRFADALGLGWPGLYALSPRLSSTMERLEGVVLSDLIIEDGPAHFKVLGVTGRCGSVDYSRSLQLDRADGFVRLRGLNVDEVRDGVDVAVPSNLESVFITSRAADFVRGNFDNISVIRLDAQEFDVSEASLLGRGRDRSSK